MYDAELEKELRTVIETGTRNINVYIDLGQMLMESEQHAEAIHVFTEAVQLEPKNSFPHCELGWALYYNGQLPEAEDSLRTASALEPSNAFVLKRLAFVVLKQQERVVVALHLMEEALRLQPDDPPTDNLLSKLRDRVKSLEKAEALFRNSLAMMPDDHTVLFNLGGVLTKLGRYEEARQALAKAKKLMPD